MSDHDVPVAPSPEDLSRLMAVAQASADAAGEGETTEQKTESVRAAIEDSAATQFPKLSPAEVKELAEQLAPIVVAMSVEPMTDGMIERLQQLEVVFTPGQAPPPDPGTPEAAAAAEAAAAPVDVAPPPRARTWAERFSGQ